MAESPEIQENWQATFGGNGVSIGLDVPNLQKLTCQ
jgi:hypothetical protein